LAFTRPKGAADSVMWQLQGDEDDAETQLRSLREKAARCVQIPYASFAPVAVRTRVQAKLR
jgi:hypothetical protein